jgi:hypothetical protein
MFEVAIKSSIPDSELPYPEDAWGRIKYRTWLGVYPYYADIRDTLLKLRLIRHAGRQNYVIGKIAAGRSVEDFVRYISTKGFGNHFIAWEDEDEIIGLRRPEGFKHQYHLRIFKDGEVRGHYELTPEAHPIKHLKCKGQEPRSEDFFEFCGDWITRA